MILIKPSVPLDVYQLAPNLRDADKAELAALGSNPVRALLSGLEQEGECFTIIEDGNAIAMFGTAPFEENVGSIWMLASPAIEKHSVRFLRECRYWIDVLTRRYSLVVNIVHADNHLHRRWLKWCGFKVSNAPVEVNGNLFYPFIGIPTNV